jgi:hypothetical protein
MNDLSFKSLTAAQKAPQHVCDMQDVWDYFACQASDPAKPKNNNQEGWRLQYLTTLQSHCGGAPLATIFTGPDLLAEFDVAFPKVRKGVHPRGDLDQKIEAYKKWWRNCRLAIEMATGTTAETQERRSRQDGWAELLDAVNLHSNGCFHPAKASPVTKLADVARRAGIEPWNLAEDVVMVRLEEAFDSPKDLQIVRKAQIFLNQYAILPEIAAVLPKEPVPIFPLRRLRQALPKHIEDFLSKMAERAGTERDEVAGKDQATVSEKTKKGWLSALRHHVRTLPHCPPNPEMDYHPITDLKAVNDVASLFARHHLFATIRRTRDVEHLPDTISHASAYEYYCDIITVLFRNNPERDDFGHVTGDGPNLISDSTGRKVLKCKFMREGRELAKGMTKKNEAWCESLVRSQTRRDHFRNMHRTMMVKADAILNAAKGENRALTTSEMQNVRQLGTCAAACAIEWAGRPIRMANVLSLRLQGSRRNFFTPDQGRATYSFTLFADETKSGKDEPETPLNAKLGGPKVLIWYLKNIRPLFPHYASSIYLFPGVEHPGQQLGRGTFDGWFQRAASAAELPMTFHQWRHGYASLMLAVNWGNLPFAAQMLGNTEGVCARNYGWIDKAKLILEGQAKVVAAMEADQ